MFAKCVLLGSFLSLRFLFLWRLCGYLFHYVVAHVATERKRFSVFTLNVTWVLAAFSSDVMVLSTLYYPSGLGKFNWLSAVFGKTKRFLVCFE